MKRQLALFPLVFALLPVPPVGAAAVKTTTLGCKQPADAAKAFDLMAKNNAAELAKFTEAKLAARDCISFGRGTSVSADVKKPPLACVRLSGDLDCYWMADSFVDLNPPEPAARPSVSFQKGRGR